MLATHGVLGLSTCFAEPALLTSVGDKGDGLIEASQLLDRSLKARLVVLSACDTAGGGKLDRATGLADGGEALSGLARAFIYAGAPSVLATAVEGRRRRLGAADRHPAAHRRQRRPRTVAEALGPPPRRASTTSRRPPTRSIWSGFVLIGDGGAVLTRSGRNPDRGAVGPVQSSSP